jgi:hypothetical protein
MTRTVLKSRVGADGVLSVRVPLGRDDANCEVTVTIEPASIAAKDEAGYVAWLESIAGRWQGDFEQLPQGEFERRDPL